MVLAIIASLCLVVTTVVNAAVRIAEIRKVNAETRKVEAETRKITG